MPLLNNIKTGIAEFILKRRLKRIERSVDAKNLSKCKDVLILSGFKDDPKAKELERLTSFLYQHVGNVSTLYYYGKEKYKLDTQNTGIKSFGNDYLNWLFIPKEGEVSEIIEREFDLVLDLTIGESFPLKYVLAMSKGKFKVGSDKNYKKEYCDMTIDISKNSSVEYLITQLKHYLTLINKEKHVA